MTSARWICIENLTTPTDGQGLAANLKSKAKSSWKTGRGYVSISFAERRRAIGSGVEHILHTDGVTSSNLVSPTIKRSGQRFRAFDLFYFESRSDSKKLIGANRIAILGKSIRKVARRGLRCCSVRFLRVSMLRIPSSHSVQFITPPAVLDKLPSL